MPKSLATTSYQILLACVSFLNETLRYKFPSMSTICAMWSSYRPDVMYVYMHTMNQRGVCEQYASVKRLGQLSDSMWTVCTY